MVSKFKSKLLIRAYCLPVLTKILFSDNDNAINLYLIGNFSGLWSMQSKFWCGIPKLVIVLFPTHVDRLLLNHLTKILKYHWLVQNILDCLTTKMQF